MSTTKQIKIQNNKVLTYTINKNGFKTITKSVVADSDKVINETMHNIDSQLDNLQIGDELFGIAKFCTFFTPTGNYNFEINNTTINNIDFGLKRANIKTFSSELGDVNFADFGEYVFINKAGTIQDNILHEYILTFNGSNWVLTEDTTTIDTDSLENFGLYISNTATQGDTIVLSGAYYNKFAVFAITYSDFKQNLSWGNKNINTLLPNGINLGISATWATFLMNKNYTLSSSTIFGYCNTQGEFILPNNMKIYCVVPNNVELMTIYNLRNDLGIDWTSYNEGVIWLCGESDDTRDAFYITSNGQIDSRGGSGRDSSRGFLGIFEVPVF